MTAIRLDKLLKSNGSGRLDKLVQKARDQQTLTDRLKAGLDGDLGASLVAASVRDEELVIVAASPAWASRLRFEAAALLAAAQEMGHRVSRCQVRVAR